MSEWTDADVETFSKLVYDWLYPDATRREADDFTQQVIASGVFVPARVMEEAERERDVLRSLLGAAQAESNRNAEDAALWWAHNRRTYGNPTPSETPPVWINADGTTSPVLPATTASAEDIDWHAIAMRMLGKVSEASQQKINAELELSRLCSAVEALADEWERLAAGNEAARGKATRVAAYYRRCAHMLRALLTEGRDRAGEGADRG